ncbi:MAG: response regulator, partial [Armatimonadetes bacterium]|nr:response regulator [Armatimonadota bacterium]
MNDSCPRALVVDDDPSVTALYKKTLTEEGYEVATAATGEEALAKLDRGRFDAAVIDLVLPGVGGMQVVAAVHEADPQSVIIITTSHASLDSAIDAIHHGVF